jgi:hypothetical protein
MVLAAGLLLTAAACGDTSDAADDATLEDQTTEAADESTSDTEAGDAATGETEADTETGEASAETTETTEAEAATDEEPRFELVGELDLTTAEINSMIEFIETSTGREFLRPPRIEIQSIADFEAGLVPDAELQALMDENAETTARLYQALGYTADGADELATNLANLGQSTDFISGRYDPDDDTVYIPDGALTGGDFDAILVHELLHALDGQHADLAGLIERLRELASSTTSTDEAFAISAVVEGRATAVQFEWMMANNVAPSQAGIPPSFGTVPAAAINGAILPYQIGAQSIMELGGPAETWHLYDEFPESSEQMVFPARIGNDAPVEVTAPGVDGEIFSEGVNGVATLLVLGIGETLQPSPLLITEILGAADGWGGDYFILSGDDEQSCLTGKIVADTPTDLTELGDLFTDWSERETTHPATRTAVVDGEELTITSCAPFNA